ncbi:acyl-CoA dehydrogenase family protein [Cupriavidus gilardii]|uniref:Acyl-CoA dehydrogenase n=1 Tax=Cupriavidus gilardii TaxID=82541 RepID=A0A6N1BIA8_9BURK|nr:acyl-CoA dehydrogenase family protein [Cupriavidus gilardii]ALD93082.1 acyl-CoA dehydrogenase [Cupriavidus gilardii CR3]QQE08528.1 acyl-CoA dehydrogenase family protein [Cupriavidus sp. ISTL7]KAB0599504.1 acyl-CoA dehydrogenase [Cupriavidus gilardii]MCT9012987.1 acyl-CoA dehydrogenase family protein [Cupriavidus gilardii]MCT9052541.1 acyl-CoA dehydrogenase family protein [Cupriavidus gilardii]
MSSLLDNFVRAELPPEAESFRAEVKRFLAAQLPDAPADRRARSWMGFDADFSRRLAARGWVGITLPPEYGGAGLDPFRRFVLVEELLAAGAPVAAHWIADRQSGPLILRYGSETQKRRHLPAICRGESFFCIGMSEPNSGSDLASVRSRASRVGDGWVLNGRKIWTTNAPHCRYMIALVRTSGVPEDKQKGLSQFIVDLSLPGVTVRPIEDLTGDAHFAEVVFDDVQLDDDALIGNEGSGWEQVNAELAFERSGPERIYSSVVLLDLWVARLRRDGATPEQQALLGRFCAQLATLRQMSIAVTARLAAGQSPVAEAALVKDLGTTLEQQIPAALEAVIAGDPRTVADADLYRTVSYLSQISPTFSLRGGTREILRGMIARSLGLR